MKGLEALDILWNIANSKVVGLEKGLKTTIEKELKALEIIFDNCMFLVYIKNNKYYLAIKRSYCETVLEKEITKDQYDLLKEMLKNE